MGENTANHMSNKNWYLEYIENSIIKRQLIQLKNGQRICIDISPKIYKLSISTENMLNSISCYKNANQNQNEIFLHI